MLIYLSFLLWIARLKRLLNCIKTQKQYQIHPKWIQKLNQTVHFPWREAKNTSTSHKNWRMPKTNQDISPFVRTTGIGSNKHHHSDISECPNFKLFTKRNKNKLVQSWKNESKYSGSFPSLLRFSSRPLTLNLLVAVSVIRQITNLWSRARSTRDRGISARAASLPAAASVGQLIR